MCECDGGGAGCWCVWGGEGQGAGVCNGSGGGGAGCWCVCGGGGYVMQGGICQGCAGVCVHIVGGVSTYQGCSADVSTYQG